LRQTHSRTGKKTVIALKAFYEKGKQLISHCFSRAPKKKNAALPVTLGGTPLILPRKAHGVSRKAISPYAVKVLYRLHQQGYQAYLVGGGVRDLLLAGEPKDFDIATDASPEEVRKLFRNCRLIGRRFRLAHVFFGAHIVEVATFRRSVSEDSKSTQSNEGMILRDNCYGTLEEDAWRRDFSVNALYYNIADFSIVDYVGGLADLKQRSLRILGDPETRYREDPVRMLRAVRFAAKLNFSIHPKTAAPIQTLSTLLQGVPSARLSEEILKLFFTGHALASYRLLRTYGLFDCLFGQAALAAEKYPNTWVWIEKVLQNTDERIREEKSSHPAFLYAALLWHPYLQSVQAVMRSGMHGSAAYSEAMEKVCQNKTDLVLPPKRLVPSIQEIWSLQTRFTQLQPRRVKRLLQHPRFRAAYDFLLLRGSVKESNAVELVEWWKNFVEANEDARITLLSALNHSSGLPGQQTRNPLKKKRRRRRVPKSEESQT
jgi:poly(A) polymerase